MANPPMMISGTPGAITFGPPNQLAGAGIGSSAAAAKVLQQQVLAQAQYGGTYPTQGGNAGFAPSPFINDPLYRIAEIISKVISYTEYEMEAGARDLSQRVYGTMGPLALPPSDCDKQALLRLAWKCRTILPPELATYAALGGGVENASGSED